MAGILLYTISYPRSSSSCLLIFLSHAHFHTASLCGGDREEKSQSVSQILWERMSFLSPLITTLWPSWDCFDWLRIDDDVKKLASVWILAADEEHWRLEHSFRQILTDESFWN